MRVRSTLVIRASLVLSMLVLAGCGARNEEDAGRGGDERDLGNATSERDAPTSGAVGGPAREDTTEESPATFEVVLRDGAVRGGPQVFRAEVGDRVRLAIRSDADDEVHVHGIDAEAPIAAGATSEVVFEAAAPGSYEVELHESGVVLGTVEVR